MKFLLKSSTLLAVMSPIIAIAQNTGTGAGVNVVPTDAGIVNTWVDLLGNWVGKLAIILIAVAVVVFFWGIITYVLAGADEEKRASGRSLMIYGIIGLFVMVGVWGLVYLLGSVLGVNVGGGIGTPGIPNPPDIN